MTLSFHTRSWFLLIPLIPSTIVSIFSFYHLLKNPMLRHALHNHVVILLLLFGLIEEFTDVIWHIYYYQTRTALSSTPAFCLAWVYCSAVAFISVYCLMSWASIERHILIFYPTWFVTKTKRLLYHYLPLSMCIIWPVTFYTTMLIILPCDIPFNYNIRLCNRYACITSIRWISAWDSIVHYIMPAFIIVSFSIALFVRVLYQRYRVRRRIDWMNYKKLAGQLLPISILSLLLDLPPMTLYFCYSLGLARTVAADYYSDTLFLTYWIVLFTPFAIVIAVPELRTKCKDVAFFWRTMHTVAPQVIMNLRTNDRQVRY